MNKQEELIQAFAEKWTAQKWGWEVDAMNEEYKEFISDLRTLLSQLVPAAPDMLDALQNLENDDNSIPEHAWKLVKDAIAKATAAS